MAVSLVITHPSLKEVTLQVLQAGFPQRDISPTKNLEIIRASPTDWADLPTISIHQNSSGEMTQHIGDSLADDFDSDQNLTVVGQSTLLTQVVEVRLWCQKPDERDRLGNMLLEELFRGRGTSNAPGPFISTDGMDLPKISGGQDEEVADTSGQYAPYPLYTRTFILSALTELTIQNPVPEFPIDDIEVTEISDTTTLEDLSGGYDTASEP